MSGTRLPHVSIVEKSIEESVSVCVIVLEIALVSLMKKARFVNRPWASISRRKRPCRRIYRRYLCNNRHLLMYYFGAKTTQRKTGTQSERCKYTSRDQKRQLCGYVWVTFVRWMMGLSSPYNGAASVREEETKRWQFTAQPRTPQGPYQKNESTHKGIGEGLR
jgi:hypothetical protein